MIGYLTGKVIKKYEKNVILDVHGVGYEVRGNTNFLSTVAENEPISVFIHTHVRENDITPHGFLTEAEKTLFLQLISVSGIGPKTGLELLNQPVEMLKSAIFTGDKVMLAKTPGLGTKTAEKIILELKNKVVPSSSEKGKLTSDTSYASEVIDALENLGYTRHQITVGLEKLDKTNATAERLITAFLKKSYKEIG